MKEIHFINELCLGGDLYTVLRSRPAFSDLEAASIIRSVLLSVNYLHTNGIVHRGINSHNIMLRKARDD